MEVLLTRRQTLQSLAFAAVGGVSFLSLAGCGGGGEGGVGEGSLPLGPEWTVGLVQGHVDVSSGPLKDAKSVATPYGSAPIGADGKFSVLGYASALGLALLLDAKGAPVATALIKSGEAEITLRRVARTLAYTALKTWHLVPEAREEVFRRLDRAPAIDGITAGLSGLTGPFQSNAAAIRDLMRRYIVPLLPNGAGRRGVDGGIEVDPSEGQSGVTVLQQGLDQIVLQNRYRRRTYVYIDRVSTTDANGMTTPLNVRVKEFPLASVNNPTSVSGYVADIGTLLGSGTIGTPDSTGNIAWVPNEIGPYSVPLSPSGAKGTKYRVAVVGPGIKLPIPEGLPADIVARGATITADAFLYDVLLPAFFFVIGPVIERITGIIGGQPTPAEEKLLKAFNASLVGAKDFLSYTIAQPNIKAKIDVGDYTGASADVQNLFLQSETYNKFTTAMTALVLEVAVRKAGYGALDAAGKAAIAAFVASIDLILKTVDLELQAFDFEALFIYWATSQQYEVFEVDVNQSKVRLTPAFGTFETKTAFAIHANVPEAAGSGGPLVTYKWKVTGPPGVTIRSKTSEGTEITSSTGDVEIVSSIGDTSTRVVDVVVEAIHNESGTANDTSLGTATGRYEIVNTKLTLSPETAGVKPGGTVALTATIANAGSTSKYLLKWSVDEGKLDLGSDLTSRRTATFTAPSTDGVSIVSVELYQQSDAGLVTLGSARGTITIQDNVPVEIPGTLTSKTFSFPEGEGTRTLYSVGVGFSPVSGATSYSLDGTGGNDTLYYGTHIQQSSRAPVVAAPGEPTEIQNCFGLTGGSSPGDGADSVAFAKSRFNGFVFKITAYFD